jgi:3,4-dihydroxy 2-butanone 4-phosphate synthase/GTP cyclohydrolase II
LADLGVFTLRLITNNPDKLERLDTPPFTIVERVPLKVPEDRESERYLATKRDRMGHWLD